MTANDLAVKILQDWRSQNQMVATALTGLAEQYGQYTEQDARELLTGLASALDECSGNLAGSIAEMTA